MGTLQDRIELSDGVSPALNRIINAAAEVTSRFEQAGRAVETMSGSAAAVTARFVPGMNAIGSVAQAAAESVGAVSSAASRSEAGANILAMMQSFGLVNSVLVNICEQLISFQQGIEGAITNVRLLAQACNAVHAPPAATEMREVGSAAAAAVQSVNRIQQAAGSASLEFQAASDSVGDMNHNLGETADAIRDVNTEAGSIPPPIYNAMENATGMNHVLEETTGILGSIKDALSSTFAQFTLANIAATAIMKLIEVLTQAPSKLAAMSDQYSGIMARMEMVAGSQDKAAALNDQIYYSALRARGGYIEMADAVSKIALTAKEAFPDARQVVPFMENVQKLFTIGGTDAVRQKDALLQLTQALGSGKLQGDEFRSIAEAAPMIEQVVASYMGVSQGALKELSSQGEITAEIMKNAILGATDEINAKMELIPLKWQDITQRIRTEGFHAFIPVFEQISRLVNSPIMKEFADSMVKGTQVASLAILGLMNNVEWLANTISNLYSQYQPAFDGLGAALLYVAGVWAIYKAGVIAAAIATGVWATVTAAAGSANILAMMITDLTRRLYTLGIAETYAGLAGSAMWFAILFPIAAVIGGIYLAVAAINSITGASISVANVFEWLGSLVLSFFMVYGMCWAATQIPLLAHIALLGVKAAWDAILIGYAWLQNAAIIAQNATLLVGYLRIGMIAAATAVWALVTQGVTAALRILNLTMLMNPIGIVIALVGAIIIAFGAWAIHTRGLRNVIAGAFGSIAETAGNAINFMIERVNGLIGILNKVSGAINNVFGTKIGMVGEISWRANAPEWGKRAYDSVQNFDLSKLFSLPGQPDSEENPEDNPYSSPPVPPLEDIAGSGKDTADNTGAMKDAMDITEEDIKYMRDAAEQEVINKYTTAEVKIEMTNHNQVSSDIDIDGMVRYTNDSLVDAMVAGAEAVHK